MRTTRYANLDSDSTPPSTEVNSLTSIDPAAPPPALLTWQVLDALRGLYPRLSPGGHVIIDDFHLPGVRAAVADFRRHAAISEPVLPVPSDRVTTCDTDWEAGGHLTIHPLTVAYWTKR
jgi:hypothetical protein